MSQTAELNGIRSLVHLMGLAMAMAIGQDCVTKEDNDTM